MKLELKAQSCTACDRAELTSRVITDEGFLVAPAVIARTGVQTYKARELGIAADGLDPNTPIRLYRPAEEVFAPDSIESFQNLPLTVKHPAGNRVTAANWKSVSVGDMRDPARNGETLGGRVTVRDAAAVKSLNGRRAYTSAGYTFELDPTPGTAADGQEYDAVMRKIRGNHAAIDVGSPRGGPVCRIADSIQTGAKAMRKFVVDGISIEIEDSTTADVFAKMQGERDTATQKLTTKVKVGDKEFAVGDAAAIQTAVDGLAKENTELKAAAVTPAQVEQRVAARVKLVGDSLTLVPKMVVDGKTDVQIQREVIATVSATNEGAKSVVDAVMGGVAVDAADPALLAIAFRTLTAAAPKAAGTSRTAADAALSAALVGAAGKGVVDNKPSGRDAYNDRNNNAWDTSKK
jgi:hypothetical protein